jgi:hypothetical protein
MIESPHHSNTAKNKLMTTTISAKARIDVTLRGFLFSLAKNSITKEAMLLDHLAVTLCDSSLSIALGLG